MLISTYTQVHIYRFNIGEGWMHWMHFSKYRQGFVYILVSIVNWLWPVSMGLRPKWSPVLITSNTKKGLAGGKGKYWFNIKQQTGPICSVLQLGVMSDSTAPEWNKTPKDIRITVAHSNCISHFHFDFCSHKVTHKYWINKILLPITARDKWLTGCRYVANVHQNLTSPFIFP